MQQHSVRKTFTYQLMPTPQQERALDRVLLHCRTLYNVALEQRKTWWGRGQGIGASYYQQKAELPDLKAACPEYGTVHSQVLQDVLLRVERTFQAFFRRLKNGQTPGYPRFQGVPRYHSFTYPQYGSGAVLDGSVLSLSKIGRLSIRLRRPLEGTPKTVTISREADGWYDCFSCAEVPVFDINTDINPGELQQPPADEAGTRERNFPSPAHHRGRQRTLQIASRMRYP